MRKQILLILFMILAHSMYSLSIEKVKEIEYKSENDLIGVSEYLPFYFHDNKIISMSDTLPKTMTFLFEEEYLIHNISINEESSVIAFTYGLGDFSIPAIFNPITNQKEILLDIVKDGGSEYIYEIVRDLLWINEDTLVYTVYDQVTGYYIMKTYNISTKQIKNLFYGLNVLIQDTNQKNSSVIYSMDTSIGIEFWIYEMISKIEEQIPNNNYFKIKYFDSHRILGYRYKNEQNNSVIEILENNKVIFKYNLDNTYSFIDYNEEFQVLLISTIPSDYTISKKIHAYRFF